MPQVKILEMYLVFWQLFLLPTITPGVECAFDLFGRHDEVFHEFLTDCNQGHYLSTRVEREVAVYIKIEHVSEMYNGIIVNIHKIPPIFFPTHQESTILKTHTRRYDRNIERCAV
jgi:hypothetical protein